MYICSDPLLCPQSCKLLGTNRRSDLITFPSLCLYPSVSFKNSLPLVSSLPLTPRFHRSNPQGLKQKDDQPLSRRSVIRTRNLIGYLPVHLLPTRNLGSECGGPGTASGLLIHLLAMPFPSKPVHTENPVARVPQRPTPGISGLRPILLKAAMVQETQSPRGE